MKNLLIPIILLWVTMPLVAINSINHKKSDSPIITSWFFTDLDIFKIKQDIETGRRGYYMTGSFTVIKTPTDNGGVAHTVDISFRNATIKSSGKPNNYIQADAQGLRNDNNSINEISIYIPYVNGTDGSVDERNIKVNWKTGSLEVVNKLANVSVIYQEHTILINGTMQKNGYNIGVSLAIAKKKGFLNNILESD